MKIRQALVPTPFGPQGRLCFDGPEGQLVDANLCFQRWFEKQGLHRPDQKAAHACPSSLADLLRLTARPREVLAQAQSLFADLVKSGDSEGVVLPAGPLGPPLDPPRSFRDFYAFEGHVAKGFEKRAEAIPASWYEMPVYYKGSVNSFIGPDHVIPWPHYTEKLDYELELGCVIGRDGRNIKEEKAVDHILGLTLLNDISARDIQKKEMAARLGPAKGKDFCSVMGPAIVTLDEWGGEIPSVAMEARINNKRWSQGQSGDAHFTFAQMIAHASMEEWLVAGDFLGSGTVTTGCGLEHGQWIQPGDTIELEAEKIGILKNTIGQKNGKL